MAYDLPWDAVVGRHTQPLSRLPRLLTRNSFLQQRVVVAITAIIIEELEEAGTGMETEKEGKR